MSFEDLSHEAKLLFVLICSPVFSVRAAWIDATGKGEAEYGAAWDELWEFRRSCDAARAGVMEQRRKDTQRAKRARI